MMRHLFLSFAIVTYVTALSREQNLENKGEGETAAEEKSRPARWATPTADQGNGAGAALAGVPPAASPVLARAIRGVSSQSTKSHSESSHSTSSVSQTLPAPVRTARATSSQSTQSHSESSHSSSSLGQMLPSAPAAAPVRAARHSQQQGTVETHRPARWATPTADQNSGAQPAIATFDHPILARPARGVTSQTTSSHSESSQSSSSVSQSQPSAPVAPPPAPARVVRNVEHKGTVGTQQQGVDQEQGRQSRAAEIQENLRNQAGSRQNRNVHTQESDGHAPVERPTRGAENQGERSDHAHQIEAGLGRQARNVHTQDGDNHSPLERETRAARNGGPDILLAADHGRQSRGVETHRQQSADSHIRQQRGDPSDPSKYRRLPLAP